MKKKENDFQFSQTQVKRKFREGMNFIPWKNWKVARKGRDRFGQIRESNFS